MKKAGKHGPFRRTAVCHLLSWGRDQYWLMHQKPTWQVVSPRHQLLHFQPEPFSSKASFERFPSTEYESSLQSQRKLFKLHISNIQYLLILKYKTLKVNVINGSSESVTLVGNAKQCNGYGRAFGSILASFKSALRSKSQQGLTTISSCLHTTQV